MYIIVHVHFEITELIEMTLYGWLYYYVIGNTQYV